MVSLRVNNYFKKVRLLGLTYGFLTDNLDLRYYGNDTEINRKCSQTLHGDAFEPDKKAKTSFRFYHCVY